MTVMLELQHVNAGYYRPQLAIRSLTLAFFEQTLQGKRSAVLEGKSHSEIVQSIHRFN